MLVKYIVVDISQRHTLSSLPPSLFFLFSRSGDHFEKKRCFLLIQDYGEVIVSGDFFASPYKLVRHITHKEAPQYSALDRSRDP